MTQGRTTAIKAFNGKRLFKDYTRRSTMKYDPATVSLKKRLRTLIPVGTKTDY